MPSRPYRQMKSRLDSNALSLRVLQGKSYNRRVWSDPRCGGSDCQSEEEPIVPRLSTYSTCSFARLMQESGMSYLSASCTRIILTVSF